MKKVFPSEMRRNLRELRIEYQEDFDCRRWLNVSKLIELLMLVLEHNYRNANCALS